MALRNGLSILAALLSCGALATAFLPAAQVDAGTGASPELLALAEASREYSRASDQLALALLRDSITAQFNSVPDDRAVSDVYFGGDISQRMREVAAVTIRQAWERLGVDSLRTRVAVVVLTDTAANERGRIPRIDFLIPVAADAPVACAVVIRLGRLSRRLEDALGILRRGRAHSGAFRQTALGPCAFFGAHGVPGVRVARWLQARQWDAAQMSDWTLDATSLGVDRFDRGNFFAAMLGESEIRFGGVGPRRCQLGYRGECAAELLSEREQPTQLAVGTASLPSSADLRLSAEQAAVLAMIRHDAGAEAFDRFWRSAEEPQNAFRSAIGIGLDDWMHGYILRVRGRAAGSPRLASTNSLAGLLVIAAGFAIAAAVSVRRSVT